MLAERSNPTEQEVYAGRLAEETNVSKTAIMTQLETAVKRAGYKRRQERSRARLKEGEMNQINVPYSMGGAEALGVASAQQRLLAAILREPGYLDMVRSQLPAEKFLLPQQRELYQAMIQCREQGIELSLATLRAYVSEEALNELSALAAKYSDVNCTPDDIRLYLDRIARGTPVAKKGGRNVQRSIRAVSPVDAGEKTGESSPGRITGHGPPPPGWSRKEKESCRKCHKQRNWPGCWRPVPGGIL